MFNNDFVWAYAGSCHMVTNDYNLWKHSYVKNTERYKKASPHLEWFYHSITFSLVILTMSLLCCPAGSIVEASSYGNYLPYFAFTCGGLSQFSTSFRLFNLKTCYFKSNMIITISSSPRLRIKL